MSQAFLDTTKIKIKSDIGLDDFIAKKDFKKIDLYRS